MKKGIEYDLETVLKTQEPHDFHCPTCNSCITKIKAYEKRNPKLTPAQINLRSSAEIYYSSLDESQPYSSLDESQPYFSLDESQPPASGEFQDISFSSDDSQPAVPVVSGTARRRMRLQPNIQKTSDSKASVPIGHSLDIIKSIVYGGLMEFIASLCIVFSAVGANVATLNVLALGLANTFGGLFLISHDLWDLKNESQRGVSQKVVEQPDRYQHLLGKRAYFSLHFSTALLSSIIFGLLPPVIYGFSFGESNNRDIKLLMVILASIICLVTLAAAKVYVQRASKSYFKTIAYYVILGFMVSSVSFVFGNLIMTFLEKIDVIYSGSVIIMKLSSKPLVCT